LAKRPRKQLSVLVIPDDGSRTLEFKVGYWLPWVLLVILCLLLGLVVIGGTFYWRAQDWERLARSLQRENDRMREDVERVEELAQVVTRMKRVDQQLRDMLSSKVTFSSAAYTVPISPRTMSGTEATGQITTVSGRGGSRLRGEVDPRWIPSIWPVSRSAGWVTAEFVDRSGVLQNKHLGVDVAAPEGTVVKATADGEVVFVGLDEVLGQVVSIDHYGAFMTRYGHNSSTLVLEGEEVRKGQPIALVGSSGRSSGLHLHYEVIEGGHQRDPRYFLPE